MLYSDEARERDLRVAKRYAPVASTRHDANIIQSLKHELYEKFLRKKKKIPTAKIWALVHRNFVLEACMVAANAMWQTVFQRLLRHLMTCQEAGGCKLYMQPIRLNALFQVENWKVMWFVCLGVLKARYSSMGPT